MTRQGSGSNPHRFRVDWLGLVAVLVAVAGLLAAVWVCVRLE